MQSLRTLTYVLENGTSLNDGSVMTAHKCVIEHESGSAYVMLFDFTGELFFQRSFLTTLTPAISELTQAMDVSTVVMDLAK